MHKTLLSSLILTASLITSCAANPYKKIDKLGKEDPAAAALLLEQEIASNPDDANNAEKLLKAAEYYRLTGEYKKSRSLFEEILENHPQSAEKTAAILGVSLIDFQSGNMGALTQIRTTAPSSESVPDTLNADRYRTLYLHDQDRGEEITNTYKTKARAYAQAHPITLEHCNADIPMEIAGKTESPILELEITEERLVEEIQSDLENRQWEKVIMSSTAFLTDHPDSEFVFQVKAFQERAQSQEHYVNKIAVLLPLSGQYEPAALGIQQALNFANQGRVQLNYYDTAWIPEVLPNYADPENPTEAEIAKFEERKLKRLADLDIQTKNLIKKIVIEDGCAMILGPLLRDIAPSAAIAAQAYGIPMLSFSSNEEVLTAGDYIFRLPTPMKQQIEMVVDHAMNEKGWKTFVAMVPDDSDGLMALEIFTEVVNAKGGNVLRHVAYKPENNDFIEDSRRLGLKSEIRPTKEKLEKDPTLDHPTVDFDAIFIPDNHIRTPLVVSALASEEFSIGSFRINRHAIPVGVIGLQGWNNSAIVERGGQYMTNAIFVDSYWPQSEDEYVKTFIKDYSTQNNHEPNRLYALCYDAMNLINDTISVGQNSRRSVKNTLQSTALTKSVTGASKFNADHNFDRQLQILIVTPKGIKKWVPVEEQTP